MLTEVADVNNIYEESLANLRDRVPIKSGKGKKNGIVSIAEKESAAKDYYANVRTNVLLAWVLSNACFSTHTSNSCFNNYLQGLLLVAILSNMKETDAFGKNVGVTKVKAYMVFILAFTAITNSVVRVFASCHSLHI